MSRFALRATGMSAVVFGRKHLVSCCLKMCRSLEIGGLTFFHVNGAANKHHKSRPVDADSSGRNTSKVAASNAAACCTTPRRLQLLALRSAA